LTERLGVQQPSFTEKRGLGPFTVSAIGLGAMRLSGPNVFGPPENRDDAIALLRAAVELGVEHIDTAQFYGPGVVNELIREALHPYPPDLVLVSKVGAGRGKRGEIFADDEPDRLRQGIEENLRTLGTDTIGVVNLRLMRGPGPDPFFEDQLQAMIAARDDGLIRAVGLSNVTLGHLLHALKFTKIACVQNAFHPADRTSQPVLDECERQAIAFVPFAPLGFGSSALLAHPSLVRISERLHCTPAQVSLAWQLAIAPNVLLIPGTSSVRHLHENVAAASVALDNHDLQLISEL
jgi:aryl-alcohol dehydrogenase-like predicted oxidoreductase